MIRFSRKLKNEMNSAAKKACQKVPTVKPGTSHATRTRITPSRAEVQAGLVELPDVRELDERGDLLGLAALEAGAEAQQSEHDDRQKTR